ncbi:hypothetical protein [Francisella salina]|uniref:Uncharacterized protein n=1 Tax=Francisella salina TaxID=573569 RepID=A0ABM5MCL7_FRAST|nr:hypothetical protein [Francisella salina]AEI36826.1 hypothetical protein F7308_1902 [Francisella salina]AEI36830.1 hypothetical protein F7308_1906 [Francisella salina]
MSVDFDRSNYFYIVDNNEKCFYLNYSTVLDFLKSDRDIEKLFDNKTRESSYSCDPNFLFGNGKLSDQVFNDENFIFLFPNLSKHIPKEDSIYVYESVLTISELIMLNEDKKKKVIDHLISRLKKGKQNIKCGVTILRIKFFEDLLKMEEFNLTSLCMLMDEYPSVIKEFMYGQYSIKI